MGGGGDKCQWDLAWGGGAHLQFTCLQNFRRKQITSILAFEDLKTLDDPVCLVCASVFLTLFFSYLNSPTTVHGCLDRCRDEERLCGGKGGMIERKL